MYNNNKPIDYYEVNFTIKTLFARFSFIIISIIYPVHYNYPFYYENEKC